MKICVITPLYAIAGVPLAQLRFARALANQGHEVDLIIGYVDHALYQLPKINEVNVILWDCPKVRGMFLPLCRYLAQTKLDVIFSAEDHLNTMVLSAAIVSRSRAKISCSSRVTPFDTYSKKPFTKRWLLKQMMRSVMWRADALTCVSQDMVKQYQQVFQNPPHQCVYNIVDDKHSRLKLHEPVDHEWFTSPDYPVLVAAGRLAHWKGFSDLIHAVKVLSTKRRVRLLILGDGPLKAELGELISSLDLSHWVQLLGYVANPLKYFAQAPIFVLSSHVEGMPNVLVEAMMCGCTPVSTDCPTGPRELLQEGKYGYLVPMRDPIAMAAGIDLALSQPIAPSLLAQAILPFEEKTVIAKHFEVLGIAN